MMLALRRRDRDDLVCRQVVELVNDYLEDALTRRDRRRFERHLRGCPNCTAYLEQLRLTVAATGRLAPEDLDPVVRDEFTRAFRAWSDGGGATGGGASAPPG